MLINSVFDGVFVYMRNILVGSVSLRPCQLQVPLPCSSFFLSYFLSVHLTISFAVILSFLHSFVSLVLLTYNCFSLVAWLICNLRKQDCRWLHWTRGLWHHTPRKLHDVMKFCLATFVSKLDNKMDFLQQAMLQLAYFIHVKLQHFCYFSISYTCISDWWKSYRDSLKSIKDNIIIN